MKKITNIIGIMFLAITIFYCDNVHAAFKELTCVYEDAAMQDHVMVVQHTDGSKDVYHYNNHDGRGEWQAPKPSETERWEKVATITWKDANLNVISANTFDLDDYCDVDNYTIIYRIDGPTDNDTDNWKKDNISREYTFFETMDGFRREAVYRVEGTSNTEDIKLIDYSNVDENKVNNTDWDYICRYGENMIDIYYNETELIIKTKFTTNQSYAVKANFDLDDIKVFGGCPTTIYNSSYYNNSNGKWIYTFYLEERTGNFDSEHEIVKYGSGYLSDFNKEVSGGKTEDTESNLDYDNICSNDGVMDAVVIIGHIIQVVKWIVPFIIIVLGMVDFGKSVISNDEKALGKATASLVKRLIAGVVIFFIPTIILALLDVIEITNGIEKDAPGAPFETCTRCLFDPNDESCN